MQHLCSTRSNSSTLIDKYIKDSQAIGDSLQTNVQRINEDIRATFSTWNRSVGKYVKYTKQFH